MQKDSFFTKLIGWANHFSKSIKNFVKSSFLSLIIITIILLLLTQMDQSSTMMVDLIERDRLSLFLSFVVINALAIVLSHYPIYTYFAANLNNSGNYTHWKKIIPFSFWPLKYFHVYIFESISNTGYKPDNWANYLRYLIGLLIHGVWIHFIISSFSPNLEYENFPLTIVKVIAYCFLIAPFIIYIVFKEKFTKYTSSNKYEIKLKRLYKKLGIWYFFIALITLLLLLSTLIKGNFSPGGFMLLLATSYAFMFNYVFFRLLRTKLKRVRSTLNSPILLPVKFFINRLLFLEKSQNYLLLFNFNFLIAVGLIVYSTLASIKGWRLQNGLPILLAFFYFYYFIIASLKKYFFVARKMKLFKSKKYRVIFIGCFVFITFIFVSRCKSIEVKTHQLDFVKKSKNVISEDIFIDSLMAKSEGSLFFIASHGGGLKANVWTLNVLNTLQKRTKGKLFKQTIALSGASGGSLGFALYTGLYKEDGNNTEIIQSKIDDLSLENFTSLDLTLTFGLDTYRKLWPLNQNIGLKDRPYYAMVKYQNIIENVDHRRLSTKSYREYWYEAFNDRGYLPSLIMNTAKTKGNRGIFWSVKQNDFNSIFPFAENLADLNGDKKTIPFYQAVSTTNRFPFLSPAAKIKGYGHYIDAGAIDNSGLLGCLDLFNYLSNENILHGKRIVFIEIINSKTLYLANILEEIRVEENIDYFIKNEKETDNISADIQTGFNLDKIPGYLSDYLKNASKKNDNLDFVQIFLPHKITMEDVESYLNGTLNEFQYNLIKDNLSEKNDAIYKITEKEQKYWFEEWQTYEPTLSRHLSVSSIRYITNILKHDQLEKVFNRIDSLVKIQ